MMHVVLLEPEIPANTGNIGRTCVSTGAHLHLIRPLGFSLEEKEIRRAGLDYWKDLDVTVYDSYEDFMAKNPEARIWYATTKALTCYTDAVFADGDYLMFGKESLGIPEEILVLVLYEALRQLEFPGLEREGELHHLHWERTEYDDRRE